MDRVRLCMHVDVLPCLVVLFTRGDQVALQGRRTEVSNPRPAHPFAAGHELPLGQPGADGSLQEHLE